MKTRCGFRSVRRCVAGGLTLLLIFALIQPALTSASERKSAARTGQSLDQQQQGKARKVTPLPPERGAPAANLPSLDETRQGQREEVKAPVPTQSTIRSRRKSGNTTPNKKSHHLRSRANKLRNNIATKPTTPQTAPPLFTNDPLKNPNDPDSFKIQAIHMTELRAAINTVRNRRHLPDYSWVKPAASGGAINTNVLISWEPIQEMRTALNQAIGLPPNGYAAGLGLNLPILAVHIQELRERVKDILGVSTLADQLAPARVDPFNQSGNQIQARDAEWSLPLVSLPGRAGLDLGISLTYSSMVWTQAGSYISFDDDWGDPSPGFKIGFPAIQGRFTNNLIGTNVYVLITSAGRRAELRRVGASNIYEAGDSSYLQLIDYGGSLLLRTTDGTQMTYHKFGSDWHCTAIEDRNGNQILANYNSFGDTLNVTDTLGRVFTFNYDGNYNLTSITQTWTVNGVSQTHTWATFGWGTVTMHPAFSEVNVVGVFEGEVIPVLTQVGLPDGSHYNFEYNSNGQATVIRRYTDDNPTGTTQGDLQRTYTTYNYDTPAADCPRITAARVWADNWSGVAGVPLEVVTYFADNHDGSHQMTTPDGTVYKEFYGGPGDLPAWQHGLITATQVLSGGTVQKSTSAAYTQDNTSVNYQMNPRVTETSVYDSVGNRRRVTFEYSVPGYTQFGLPYVVREYAADATTVLRETVKNYQLDQPYLDRRIIGLVSQVHLIANGYQAKVTYGYDDPARLSAQAVTAPLHDQSYDGYFTVRGNVTSVSRWDVTDINNSTKALTTFMNYNAAGSLLSTIDPSNHTSSIAYADARGTFAYPTTMTDGDGYQSFVQYNYDFGAKTRVQGPPPQGQANGVIQTFSYDEALRVKRVTTVNTGAYVHYDYGPNHTSSFASINSVAPNYWDSDTFTNQFFDGLGRVFAVASNHPGSLGGNKGQYIRYDVMGRAVQQTNPFEMDSGWNPTGDDLTGYQFNVANTFDWKGRPVHVYHMDGSYQTFEYAGCGCAGGEMVTITDEMTRRQKIYADVLGRQWKTEVLNWDGSVYSTTTNTLNARDQVTNVRQMDNATGAYHDTTMDYDGYARLWKKHVPEQNAGTATVYTYRPDDTVETITDARGASATYIYNHNRHLIDEIHYSAPSGIAPTSNVTFGYDAAGNRTSMTDGLGSKSYSYNQLSQMMSETRTFSGVGSFSLIYDYNVEGALKTFTDSTGMTINYGYDALGRVNGVTSSNVLVGQVTNYASSFVYRASNNLKQISVGGRTATIGYGSRLQASSFNIPSVVNETYEYGADGRLSFLHNTMDNNFDRAFSYDHAGRITEAFSGGAARNDSGDVPMYETFYHNAFNNTSGRYTESWGNPYNDFPVYYTNNRRDGWGYDADGRVTTIDTRSYAYDSAGQNISVTGQRWTPGNNYVPTSTTSDFDGDGSRIKEVINDNGTVTTTYYLRSSVLGNVVEELKSSGTKQAGYVYAPGGGLLATQEVAADSVTFKQISPAGLSQYESFSNIYGSVHRKEFDPAGATIPLFNHSPGHGGSAGEIPDGGGGALDGRFGAMSNPGAGCIANGVYSPCDMAFSGFWGTALADLPGFGTNWGSFSDLESWKYEQRLAYTRARNGSAPRRPERTPLDPQDANQAPDLRRIRENLDKALQDADCARFIKDLLGRLSTDKNPVMGGGNLLKIFDIVTGPDQGGVVRAPIGGGRRDGSIETKDETILLESISPPPANQIPDNRSEFLHDYQVWSDSDKIIHELIHGAGLQGWSDWQIAEAVSHMPNTPELPKLELPRYPTPEEAYRHSATFSTYWDKVLKQHCRPAPRPSLRPGWHWGP